MKNCSQRINNVIGQLSGIKDMMARDKVDCFQVITQLKAVKSAVSSIMEKYLTEEFSSCLLQSSNKKQAQLKKILGEFIKK